MYAILETGGKQYSVKVGDIIRVEKLAANEGESFTFDKVLFCADGDEIKIGAPVVDGASVKAAVLGQNKAKKVVVYKYKPKKGYHRKIGHRQPYTRVKIEAINA